MFRRTPTLMAQAGNDHVGATGSVYQFKGNIQERPYTGRVWLAMSGQEKFIRKDIPRSIFDNFNENIKPRLHHSPHIRMPCDTVPGQRIFVYRYMTDDFLSLVKRGISIRARKQILKSSLLGIAELHEQQIVHLDIKPDNILVNCQYGEKETIVKNAQITDLENAAYLPTGRCIKGMLAGNDNWRSPEAYFRGELNKPTDIFTFGNSNDDFRLHQAQGALPALIRLQHQVSYFGDRDGVDGLLKHISDDDTSCQVLEILWDKRTEEHIPYKPFTEWPEAIDSVFTDLIQRLMSLDPAKRPTASEVLDHPWFAGV
ncbi:putative calcium/calmodulin dependent protein kinase [Aspergillus avenaceus]|uniref:Putative calcium/calmodulin dependent protein kinase n=1 Tax=Aspergillus avenaceus TaxID=36643 RepID=A0A5N6U3D1_ASPAV|nr:putative calcium/calmodulin dependent protein kinase [Aspergillus avenaceus]